MSEPKFNRGDVVRMSNPGVWNDGMIGMVVSEPVERHDGEAGVLIEAPGLGKFIPDVSQLRLLGRDENYQ